MRHPELYYHNKLTIVVPLINRESLTVRYLEYLESIKFPFKVLLADGGKDVVLQYALEKREIAPNLDYTYIRFPYDETFSDFYSKNKKSMELVETPYVMFNCNDDFPVVSGLYECIDFLDQYSEYVGASGIVAGCSILNKDLGLILLDNYFSPIDHLESFQDENPLLRILPQITGNKAWNFYYGVYRTRVACEITDDLFRLNFQDLRLHECYFIQGVSAMGKLAFLDNCYSYFRQRGTSYGTSLLRPWYNLIFFNSWHNQFESYLDFLSKKIFDNVQNNYTIFEIKKKLKNSFEVEFSRKPFFERHAWQKIRYSYTYYLALKSCFRKIFLSFSFARKLENKLHQKKFLALAGSQKSEVEGIIKQLQL
jgi:glycosyltransferase domain-containing protein